MPSARLKARPEHKLVSRDWQFDAIGTRWWISVREPVRDADSQALQKAVSARVERFDAVYSRFRPDSVITRMSEKAGEYRLPADSGLLMSFYRELYDATGGAVTPLVGGLLAAAGYDADYSLRPKQLQTPPAWDEAISYHNDVMTVRQPVLLDFGAAGKGYLVDLVGEVLSAQGVRNFCIDAGGDMLVRGRGPLRVGLEHPDDEQQAIGVASLAGRAIAGSAGNRRAWAGYHHILDPFTLTSPPEPKAVWVVADSALLADGLTTALFFAAPERLDRFNFEYLVVNSKNQYKRSPGFPAELF